MSGERYVLLPELLVSVTLVKVTSLSRRLPSAEEPIIVRTPPPLKTVQSGTYRHTIH